MKRVTVYCASSNKVDDRYFDDAKVLAREIANNNYTLVYGGGAHGLMGCIADTALECGGKVVGIMPEFMTKVEWNHPSISELVLVDDMHQRKALLAKDVDAIVALPGGCGTLEELSEVITLKRLGKITCPIIIVNLDGFYDNLIALLDQMISENFLREEHRKIWSVVDNSAEVIEAIENAYEWSAEAIEYAAV